MTHPPYRNVTAVQPLRSCYTAKDCKAFEWETIELAKNSTRQIQQNNSTYRQVKSGSRVERCLKWCFHMLNIKTSSSLVSHFKTYKICSGDARPIVNNQITFCALTRLFFLPFFSNLKSFALNKCENKSTYYLIINLNCTCSYVKLSLTSFVTRIHH